MFVEGRQQNRVEVNGPDAVVGLLEANLLIDHGVGEIQEPIAEPERAAAVAGAHTPCPVSVSNAEATWTRIEAGGFSFCVPASMHRRGTTTWRGEDTTQWGVGDPPALPLHPQERGIPLARDQLPKFSPRDTIDGRPAKVWQVYSAGRYYSGVRFEAPRVFIAGEAGNATVLALHQALYRTARFR